MESVLFIFTIIFILIIAQLIKSEYNRKWKIFTVFSLLYYAVIAFVGLSGLLPSAGFTTVEKNKALSYFSPDLHHIINVDNDFTSFIF